MTTKKTIQAAAVIAVGLFSTSVYSAGPESDDPIKIALNDWSSQNVSSYILGGILSEIDYNVEYIQADAMAQFAGLETGDITMQTEIWPTTQGARFAESVASGNLTDMGELGLKAREEWWYPLYMKEKCPTLPDWRALLEESCAAAFSTPQTAPKGRYLGGPATWEGFDEERVKSLKLPFEVIHAGTDANLWAELDSAYKRKAAIMLWVYSPHWWPTKYEGEFVEFPPYSDACYEDASSGVNPNDKYDCGKPQGEMHKAAWSDGNDKWPGAYHVMRNFRFDLNTYADLVKRIDLDGNEAQEVAKDWVAENEAIWRKWVK
ncbi:MAG: ABC transporter substrate-binding protein [Gammaproteobacteria bacterium]|nr:ABC transporter substrate-binding protein [Gammaproteobacteria bacterium]MDH3464774.1 ABC transporter substrate-binding protein [Gammaproteobacteria bacterium]